MSFIDASYFIGDLNIPNSGSSEVAERITWYIQQYEPKILQQLLGYPLYKAFLAGMSVVAPATPDQRFLNILYGTEYTDLNGDLRKWKGLIVTDSPTFNLAGDLVYKKPVYITIGTTPGFIANTGSATMDGTNGTDDWREWTPILTRGAIMKPGIDYTWDIDNGILQLLGLNNVFMGGEDLFAEFELRTDNVPAADVSNNASIIAPYVYYWYYRSLASQSTGIGEVQTNAENASNISPRRKMITALNMVHDWTSEFLDWMATNETNSPTTYPEWTYRNRLEAARAFGFVNPIF